MFGKVKTLSERKAIPKETGIRRKDRKIICQTQVATFVYCLSPKYCEETTQFFSIISAKKMVKMLIKVLAIDTAFIMSALTVDRTILSIESMR